MRFRKCLVAGCASLMCFALVATSQAAILPADELDLASLGAGGAVTVANSAEIIAEAGQAVDDTYDGTITFDFTISWDSFDGGVASNTFGAFQLMNGTAVGFSTGNVWPRTTWHSFKNGTAGGTGHFLELDNGSGPQPIVIGEAQTFQVVIDYVPGGDDLGTLYWNGNANPLAPRDHSFDSVRVATGNVVGDQADFTGMAITASNPIPEPSSVILVALGLCGLFVTRRRS